MMGGTGNVQSLEDVFAIAESLFEFDKDSKKGQISQVGGNKEFGGRAKPHNEKGSSSSGGMSYENKDKGKFHKYSSYDKSKNQYCIFLCERVHFARECPQR